MEKDVRWVTTCFGSRIISPSKRNTSEDKTRKTRALRTLGSFRRTVGETKTPRENGSCWLRRSDGTSRTSRTARVKIGVVEVRKLERSTAHCISSNRWPTRDPPRRQGTPIGDWSAATSGGPSWFLHYRRDTKRKKCEDIVVEVESSCTRGCSTRREADAGCPGSRTETRTREDRDGFHRVLQEHRGRHDVEVQHSRSGKQSAIPIGVHPKAVVAHRSRS